MNSSSTLGPVIVGATLMGAVYLAVLAPPSFDSAPETPEVAPWQRGVNICGNRVERDYRACQNAPGGLQSCERWKRPRNYCS